MRAVWTLQTKTTVHLPSRLCNPIDLAKSYCVARGLVIQIELDPRIEHMFFSTPTRTFFVIATFVFVDGKSYHVPHLPATLASKEPPL